jgi:hypothetical protein
VTRKRNCKVRGIQKGPAVWRLFCFGLGLFEKIKHYRHLFSRFDKLARRFQTFLHFADTLIWLC